MTCNHRDGDMDKEAPITRTMVKVSEFVEDFSRGMSEINLCEKFGLSAVQLPRLVNTLRNNGRLGEKRIEARRNIIEGETASDTPPAAEHVPSRAHVDLDTGLVLHCPSCGAPVKRNSPLCGYCASPLDFSLKGKTIHCVHCYQRTAADGRFCVVCGKPVQIRSSPGELLEDRFCPRCATPLRSASIGDFSIIACDTCSGLFISHETFDLMQEKSQRALLSLAPPRESESTWETSFSYVKCPVCNTWMNRKNFAGISGVIVDTCAAHGIWFDQNEMERIMDFIARGGIEKARIKDLENRTREASVNAAIRKDKFRNDLPDYSFGNEFRANSSQLDLLGLVGEIFRIFR